MFHGLKSLFCREATTIERISQNMFILTFMSTPTHPPILPLPPSGRKISDHAYGCRPAQAPRAQQVDNSRGELSAQGGLRLPRGGRGQADQASVHSERESEAAPRSAWPCLVCFWSFYCLVGLL